MLSGISVQKARDKAVVMGELRASGFTYVNGIEGSTSSVELTPKSYLNETYRLPDGYSAETVLKQQAYT